MPLLQVKNISKTYTTRFGGNKVEALKDVSFEIQKSEFIAIMGESGSGKTTLLNLIASLDKPTTGSIILSGINTGTIKEKQLATFRREHLGFVFQDFNLLDTFSNKDNIFLPLVLSNHGYEEMNSRLLPLAKALNIEKILKKYPYEISGGQKQRVAIARALITNPDIIFADEPTGALDSKSSENLLELFEDINQNGQTILMVTHSTASASHASRVLFIRDGKVYHQLYRGDMAVEAFRKKISDALTVISTGGSFS